MNNQRELARAASIIAYRNRVIGHIKLAGGSPIFGNSRILYSGEFPFQQVADACALPREFREDELQGVDSLAGNRRAEIHKPYWDALYKMFDEEWRAFARDRAA